MDKKIMAIHPAEGDKGRAVYRPRLERLEQRIAPMSSQGALHISDQGAAHNQDPPVIGQR